LHGERHLLILKTANSNQQHAMLWMR